MILRKLQTWKQQKNRLWTTTTVIKSPEHSEVNKYTGRARKKKKKMPLYCDFYLLLFCAKSVVWWILFPPSSLREGVWRTWVSNNSSLVHFSHWGPRLKENLNVADQKLKCVFLASIPPGEDIGCWTWKANNLIFSSLHAVSPLPWDMERRCTGSDECQWGTIPLDWYPP